MTRTVAVLALVAGLAFAPSAQATDITPDVGPSGARYQEWVDVSPVPTPPRALAVVEGSCPDGQILALACTGRGDPTIYMADTQEYRTGSLRYRFLHEVGHQFDFQMLLERDRAEVAAILGDATYDPEAFAHAYAYCATGSRSIYDEYGVGTVEQAQAVCAVASRATAHPPCSRDWCFRRVKPRRPVVLIAPAGYRVEALRSAGIRIRVRGDRVVVRGRGRVAYTYR